MNTPKLNKPVSGWKYMVEKAGPYFFKVNVLNRKGKEVWQYCRSMETARRLQEKANSMGLHSSILQKSKKTGKYVTI